jgi:hypothetical protein
MAEADEARGPVDVGFFGSHGHVLEADGAAEGVEEMLWVGWGMKMRAGTDVAGHGLCIGSESQSRGPGDGSCEAGADEQRFEFGIAAHEAAV